MPLTDDVVVRRKQGRRAAALEERLRTIVEAAAELFSTRGYNATSLREVAARVGLSPAGLIHHFPDKAALLEAVLDDRLGRAAEQFGLETEDGEEFLRGMLRASEHDLRDPVGLRLFCVLSAEAIDPGHPAHGYFRQWYAEVRGNLAAALVDLERRGLYRGRPVPPETAAAMLSALRDGANLQWLLDPGGVDLPTVVRESFRPYVDLEL